VNTYPDDIFFAAESAAEATVDRLYQRAEAAGPNAAGVTAVVSVVSVLAIGLWVSPLGKRVRKKVAEAITPKS